MINLFKKHWSLIIAVLILWMSLAILLNSAIKKNHGHFCYPLDDTYIHMSMGKNLALNGVWGVSKYEFSSASSSPFWTLLISLVYLFFRVNEISPLIINLLLATLLILTIYNFFKKFLLPPVFILLSLLAIIFLTPLLPVITGGMEHVMHALLTMIFVILSANILSSDHYRLKDQVFLLVLAPFLTTARYEGLFLILVVCSLFVLHKRYFYSILLGALAVLPLVIYGVISVMKGWYFLPNSVLLKGHRPAFSLTGIHDFLYYGIEVLVTNMHIFILVLIATCIFILQYRKQKIFWEKSIILLAVFIMTTVLHVLFANLGWLYRYEAYLVVFGISVISIGLFKSLPYKFFPEFNKSSVPMYLAIIFLLFIILYPFYERGKKSLFVIQRGMKNIYEQQYQMGLFLRQFYKGEEVAANDIGAINYLSDVKCLDLWGLSNMDVAKNKMNNMYSAHQIDLLTQHKKTKIAVIYTEYFDNSGGIPSGWIKVGDWTIEDNIVCGGKTVSFYAINSDEKNNLISNLKAFSSQLPKNVVQAGDYIK